MEMTLSIITAGTAIAAIIISILTLRSNNKMLESSTRPYINIYSNKILGDSSFFYIIVKKFGSTGAYIEDITIDSATREIMDIIPNRSYIDNLKGSRLEPGQSVTHLIISEDVVNDNHISTFNIKYSSDTSVYHEEIKFNILSNIIQPTMGKSNTSIDKQILLLYQDEMRRSL